MTIQIVHHVKNNTLSLLESVLQRKQLPFEYLFCQTLQQQHTDLSGVHGLILLGGMESAAEPHLHPFMPIEHEMIRNALNKGIPVFGICLGAQMMAKSLGAVVEKNKVANEKFTEIGWSPITLTPEGERDPVLSHLDGMCQFQWHEDTYHLPAGATHLASTDYCNQQAFRLNNQSAPAYGVQFHPEVSLSDIQSWLSASKSLNPERAQSIWQESEQKFSTYSAASLAMFQAFCDLAF